MKFNKSTLFFIILAVALLATLGMNIKEGLTSDSQTHTRQAYRDEMARRSNVPNMGSDTISSIETGVIDDDDDDETERRRKKFWSERRGVRRVDIPEGDEDLYVLKSQKQQVYCFLFLAFFLSICIILCKILFKCFQFFMIHYICS